MVPISVPLAKRTNRCISDANKTYDSYSLLYLADSSDDDLLYALPSSDDESNEDDNEDELFSHDDNGFVEIPHDFIPRKFTFSGASNHYDSEGPFDIYMKLTRGTWELMTQSTNMHGKELYDEWHEVTANEMQVFVGLLLYMGLVRYPSIKDYWRQHPLYNNTVAPAAMARERFKSIRRSWCFCMNEDRSNSAWKIQPLIDTLKKNFSEPCFVGDTVVVDETVVGCRARFK